MIIDKEELVSELELKSFGQKGWLTNREEVCPCCGKGGKWGIMFMENNESAIFHCFKCGQKLSIRNYLIKINRKDLIKNDYQVSKKNINLTPLIKEEEEYEEEESKEAVLPKGLRLLEHDPYLDGRHFLQEHYKEFEPSYTKSILEENLSKHNYIIFKIKQGDKIMGWLARSRYDKEWHEQNLNLYKEKNERLVLRYMNSRDGFAHILGGYNYIGAETEIVILVEGLFDKVNIDYLMDLHPKEELACCFTFGKKISNGQLRLLKETNVKRIILMYDEDALKESKENAMNLSKRFEVLVCRIKDKDIDPGNMTLSYLNNVLLEAKDPLSFYLNNLLTIKS